MFTNTYTYIRIIDTYIENEICPYRYIHRVLFTHVRTLTFTDVHSCLLITFTDVYLCTVCYIHGCTLMFTDVHSYSLMYQDERQRVVTKKSRISKRP